MRKCKRLQRVHHAFIRQDGKAVSLCCRHVLPELAYTGYCLRPASDRRCQACDAAEAALFGPDAHRRGSGEGRPWRWAEADRVCPTCGLTWRKLTTGYTYRDVYELLVDYSEIPSEWRYKRRQTVLGTWHALKLSLWDEHLTACAIDARVKRRRQRLRKHKRRTVLRARLDAVTVPF